MTRLIQGLYQQVTTYQDAKIEISESQGSYTKYV